MDNITLDVGRRDASDRGRDSGDADRRRRRRARDGGGAGAADRDDQLRDRLRDLGRVTRATTATVHASAMARAGAGCSEPLRGAGAARIDGGAWLVGGAVRDRLLGRATSDFDVAIDGDPARAARTLARRAGGHAVRAVRAVRSLGAWSPATAAGSSICCRSAGRSIEDDLASARPHDQRDRRAGRRGAPGRPVRRSARPATPERCGWSSPEAFRRDPLRTLRLARLAAELDFAVEPATPRRPRARSAPGLREVAPERVFAELKRLDRLRRGRGRNRADRAARDHGGGAAGAVDAARDRAEPLSPPRRLRPHARGAGGQRSRSSAIRRRARRARRSRRPSSCAEPLANELTRWQALRFGALLHDIAKPQTRGVTAEGRVTFIGHDAAGAEHGARCAEAPAGQRAAHRARRGARPPPPSPRIPRPRDAALQARGLPATCARASPSRSTSRC